MALLIMAICSVLFEKLYTLFLDIKSFLGKFGPKI